VSDLSKREYLSLRDLEIRHHVRDGRRILRGGKYRPGEARRLP
jgi:hypothetical protein